jgi:hypothetical protein
MPKQVGQPSCLSSSFRHLDIRCQDFLTADPHAASLTSYIRRTFLPICSQQQSEREKERRKERKRGEKEREKKGEERKGKREEKERGKEERKERKRKEKIGGLQAVAEPR